MTSIDTPGTIGHVCCVRLRLPPDLVVTFSLFLSTNKDQDTDGLGSCFCIQSLLASDRFLCPTFHKAVGVMWSTTGLCPNPTAVHPLVYPLARHGLVIHQYVSDIIIIIIIIVYL